MLYTSRMPNHNLCLYCLSLYGDRNSQIMLDTNPNWSIFYLNAFNLRTNSNVIFMISLIENKFLLCVLMFKLDGPLGGLEWSFIQLLVHNKSNIDLPIKHADKSLIIAVFGYVTLIQFNIINTILTTWWWWLLIITSLNTFNRIYTAIDGLMFSWTFGVKSLNIERMKVLR